MTLEENGILQERIIHMLDEHFQLGGRLQKRIAEPEDVYGLLTRSDMILVTDDTLYVVEMKQRLTTDHVARALLIKQMLEIEGSEYPNPEMVLVAKVVPRKVQSVADAVGILIIRLESDIQLPFSTSTRPSRVSKISHWKSWKVTTDLIRSGPTSIRKLSITSGVSYGWTHATVRHLVEMGVATRNDEGVSITDKERLLDGVAWERPLTNLLVRTVQVSGGDYMETAREIEDAMTDWNMEHAFTGFTSGGIYTGYGQRFDRIFMYIDPKAVDELERSISDGMGRIELMMHAPDRNLWREKRVVEGITIVSPAQTLLDLIGLGYGARTMAREMWKYYETTTDR
jgi:hypothetical protein